MYTDELLSAVLEATTLPTEVQAALVNLTVFDTAPRHILEALVKNCDSEVREALAESEGIPENLLRLLAEDEDNEVRSALAYNPDTPQDVLLSLFPDGDASTRSGVARNLKLGGNVFEEQFELIAADSEPYIRVLVCRNESTPASVLSVLSSDPVPYVRLIAEESLAQRNLGE